MQTNSTTKNHKKPEIAPVGDINNIWKTQEPKSLNGVPLGGFGTGKIEITPDGALRHFTTNNNYTYPIDGMPGSFLGVKIENRVSRILQLATIPGLSSDTFLRPEQIKTDGLYPINRITYDLETEIDLSLTAFSPISPLDYENAMKPGAYFIFHLKNKSHALKRVTLLFSWENINDCWGDKVAWDNWVPKTAGVYGEDRYNNQFYENESMAGVIYQASKDHPEYKNFCIGNFSLMWEKSDNARLSFQSFNPNNEHSLQDLMKSILASPARASDDPSPPPQTTRKYVSPFHSQTLRPQFCRS